MDQNNLESEDQNEHKEEDPVMEEAFEHIGISSSDLSAVDHVEKLQENKDVEDVSEHSLLGIACPELGAFF